MLIYAELLLGVPGPFKPSMGSIIGYIDVLDSMHIELDVIIHSFPDAWANIIQCTTGNNHPRIPGILIHPTSATTMGFAVKFSNDGDENYGPSTGGALVAGTNYHLEIDISQGTHKVTVNGIVVVNELEVGPHALYSNVMCYASDPWHPAADVTISNLYVAKSGIFCNICRSAMSITVNIIIKV